MVERAHLEIADLAATRALGRELGARLQAGDCLVLSGELGAGKTTFAKALAAGLGLDPDDVTSPSFTLVEVHPTADGLCFVHADAFRLGASAEAEALGLLEFERAILVIEWGEKILSALPEDRLQIWFAARASDEQRAMTLLASGERSRELLAIVQAAASGD